MWEKAILEEVQFWEQYVATEGLEWKDEYQMRLDPQSLLQENLIIHILNELPSLSVSILDVGAGPLTVIGRIYPGKLLNITAVDALAFEYDRILKEAHIVPPVRTILCHGERLLDTFGPDSFDIAYARNSVDHSYNPLLVIKNMLCVVKANGFVLLRHKRNEGERARYAGLHRWNFDMKQGEFILWSQEVEYNLTQMLCHDAEIECYFDREWVVGMIKKMDRVGNNQRINSRARQGGDAWRKDAE